MKRALLLPLLLCLAAAAQEPPFTRFQEETGWTVVITDYYQCTLFPGSMSPVWFNAPDGRRKFPRHFLLDWIKAAAAPDTAIHYLRHDCYAETAILERTEERLVFECKGRFCLGRKTFAGVTARYRYTILRHSPEMLLEGELTRDPGAELPPCIVNLGVLAWERTPFTHFQRKGGPVEPFYAADAKAPLSFSSSDGLALAVDGLRIGIAGPAAAWNNARRRYFTYLTRAEVPPEERRWDGKAPCRFTVRFVIDGRTSIVQ